MIHILDENVQNEEGCPVQELVHTTSRAAVEEQELEAKEAKSGTNWLQSPRFLQPYSNHANDSMY